MLLGIQFIEQQFNYHPGCIVHLVRNNLTFPFQHHQVLRDLRQIMHYLFLEAFEYFVGHNDSRVEHQFISDVNFVLDCLGDRNQALGFPSLTSCRDKLLVA